MRAPLWLLFCALAARSQSTPPAESPALTGQVINAATGKPVKDATLKLVRALTVFTTTSDDAGNFAFVGIEPGRYNLSVERMGFVLSNYGAPRPLAAGTAITLAAEQKIAGLELKLTPQATIAGQVLDSDGDPVRAAAVTLLRQKYVNGRKQLSPLERKEVANYRGADEQTDDQGTFRFFGLAPGRYYIKAMVGNSELLRGAADRSAKPAPDAYVTTYYPSTTNSQAAKMLELTPGKALTHVDILLARAPMVDIGGHVSETTPVATFRPSMALFAPDGSFAAGASIALDTGEFHIHRPVPPGRYWLIAELIRANAPWYFSRQALELSGSVTNIHAVIGAGVRLHGTVRVEDRREPVDLHALHIVLRPFDVPLPDLHLPKTDVAADGSFAMDYLGPDRYWVTLQGLPVGTYLKSVRSGEKELLDRGLDLTREAPDGLEIVLSGKPGAIEGTTFHEVGQPVPGAIVALVPQSATRRQRPEWYRSTTADQQGHFQLADLPPGQYRLFVWDDVEDGAWMDPEFLKPIEAQATAVTVAEGTSQSVILKWNRPAP